MSSSSSPMASTSPSPTPALDCPFCPATFKVPRTFFRHIHFDHDEEGGLRNDGDNTQRDEEEEEEKDKTSSDDGAGPDDVAPTLPTKATLEAASSGTLTEQEQEEVSEGSSNESPTEQSQDLANGDDAVPPETDSVDDAQVDHLLTTQELSGDSSQDVLDDSAFEDLFHQIDESPLVEESNKLPGDSEAESPDDSYSKENQSLMIDESPVVEEPEDLPAVGSHQGVDYGSSSEERPLVIDEPQQEVERSSTSEPDFHYESNSQERPHVVGERQKEPKKSSSASDQDLNDDFSSEERPLVIDEPQQETNELAGASKQDLNDEYSSEEHPLVIDEQEDVEEPQYNTPPKPLPQYRCPDCLRIFNGPTAIDFLKDHLSNGHARQVYASELSRLRGNFRCTFCPRTLPIAADMEAHMKSEHFAYKEPDLDYQCPVCEGGFIDRPTLRSHIATAHPHHHVEHADPETGMYKCTFCIVEFKMVASLKRHQVAMHFKPGGHTQKLSPLNDKSKKAAAAYKRRMIKLAMAKSEEGAFPPAKRRRSKESTTPPNARDAASDGNKEVGASSTGPPNHL